MSYSVASVHWDASGGGFSADQFHQDVDETTLQGMIAQGSTTSEYVVAVHAEGQEIVITIWDLDTRTHHTERIDLSEFADQKDTIAIRATENAAKAFANEMEAKAAEELTRAVRLAQDGFSSRNPTR